MLKEKKKNVNFKIVVLEKNKCETEKKNYQFVK